MEDERILKILEKQLQNFWDISDLNSKWMMKKVIEARKKTDKSFLASRNKYFLQDGFSVFNSVQYSVFLYYLSNLIGNDSSIPYGVMELDDGGWWGGGCYADSIYYLNKIMNGVDWYWGINLPEHFVAEHPIGTVLGRAQYGDYLCVYQGVTIGGNRRKNEICYPIIGDYVTLYANSSVIGEATIGNKVVIAANTFIKDEAIPDNSIVFGSSPYLKIKRYSGSEMDKYISPIWEL